MCQNLILWLRVKARVKVCTEVLALPGLRRSCLASLAGCAAEFWYSLSDHCPFPRVACPEAISHLCSTAHICSP